MAARHRGCAWSRRIASHRVTSHVRHRIGDAWGKVHRKTADGCSTGASAFRCNALPLIPSRPVSSPLPLSLDRPCAQRRITHHVTIPSTLPNRLPHHSRRPPTFPPLLPLPLLLLLLLSLLLFLLFRHDSHLPLLTSLARSLPCLLTYVSIPPLLPSSFTLRLFPLSLSTHTHTHIRIYTAYFSSNVRPLFVPRRLVSPFFHPR